MSVSVVNPKTVYQVRETLSLMIVARDANGRPKSYGEDFLLAKLHTEFPIKTCTAGKITDYGNGIYLATFLLPLSGSFSVSVILIHPSEVIQVLKRIHDTYSDVRNTWCQFSDQKANISEWTKCGFNPNDKVNPEQVCDFSKPTPNATWYCYRPKGIACDTIMKCINNETADHILVEKLVSPDEAQLFTSPNCPTWLTALDSNKPTLVRAIFVDMSKAFDRVDHALLLERVMDIQVSPRMQRWIFSYLQNRRQRVILDDETSAWRTLTSGVPQGGVLSPYLFLLFMSSRTTVHHDTTVLADLDTTVAEETPHLDCWAEENRMILNGSKSQLLQICFSKSVPIPPSITMCGQPVPSVGSAKGLGFILDRNLSFSEQVIAMTSKASRRLHYLRLLTKQGTSVTDLVQIYMALVRQVLEYCHVLLVGCSKEQEMAIERVQRRALRIISLGGRRSVPDLPTLKTRREEAAVHLFERMLRDDHPLNDLIPPTRYAETRLSLRNAERISLPPARTKRLRNSFLHCAIRFYKNRPTLETQ
ncbi:Neurexophilin [Branchiostoma belcheri]|nr:Neurexophilin [Branchiostoma belcheri]